MATVSRSDYQYNRRVIESSFSEGRGIWFAGGGVGVRNFLGDLLFVNGGQK